MRTSPFRGADGELLRGSVAEAGYRRLGGVDQWVMIRGASVLNPPLILLHGGPGWSETRFFRACNAPLERSFTVVYWDQRGAGRSFDRTLQKSSLNVEQFIADLDELVDLVRTRLGKERVALFGHSWGSALGPLYAARFAEKVSAYVGSGQIGDWAAGERAAYDRALGEAERRHRPALVRRLRVLGPPPYRTKALFAERMAIQRLDGDFGARRMIRLGRMMLARSESSLFDLPRAMRAFRFSIDAMWPEVTELNLLVSAPRLRMPVFFFLGRRDHWVLPEMSLRYFEALSAPAKQLVWFEDSGHEPFMDEPSKFNTAMVELVQPVAIAAS